MPSPFDIMSYLQLQNQVPNMGPMRPEYVEQMSPEDRQNLIDMMQAKNITTPTSPQPTDVTAPPPGPATPMTKIQMPASYQKAKPTPMQTQHEIEQELYEQVKQGLMRQGLGIQNLEQQKALVASQPTQVDLSPLAAYVDSIVPNSKLAENYKRPETETERSQKLFNLEDAIQKAKQGMSQEQIAALKEQLNAGIYKQIGMQARLNATTGLREDTIAARAADAFDKHPVMEGLSKQRNQIDLDKHTLEQYANSEQGVPVTLLNEMATGQARAIGGGNVVGLGSAERVEIRNAPVKIASFLQGLGPGVQYVKDPGLIQYLQTNFDRLGHGYDNNLYYQAQKIAKGRDFAYKHTPGAQEVVKAKVESYNPKNLYQDSQPTASTSDQLPKIGEIQDGHRYIGGKPSDPKSWEIVK